MNPFLFLKNTAALDCEDISEAVLGKSLENLGHFLVCVKDVLEITISFLTVDRV